MRKPKGLSPSAFTFLAAVSANWSIVSLYMSSLLLAHAPRLGGKTAQLPGSRLRGGPETCRSRLCQWTHPVPDARCSAGGALANKNAGSMPAPRSFGINGLGNADHHGMASLCLNCRRHAIADHVLRKLEIGDAKCTRQERSPSLRSRHAK